MKRILRMFGIGLWIIALTLGVCPISTVTAASHGVYEYEVLSNGNAMITKYHGLAENLTIPDTVDGHKVTAIGDVAFISCSTLHSVFIPEGVTSIGELSFGSCESLTSVHLPDSLVSIGQAAFGDTNLVSLELPKNVRSLSFGIFLGCSSFSQITVAEDNPYFCDVDGVLFDKNQTTLVIYPRNRQSTSFTVPDGVVTIGEAAFMECYRLRSIELPDTVTDIQPYAFSYTGIKNIILPSQVSEIDEYAFMYCDSLTDILIPASVRKVGQYSFFGCDSLKSIYYQGNEIIWKTMTIDKHNELFTGATLHYTKDMMCGDMNADGQRNTMDALLLYGGLNGSRTFTIAQRVVSDFSGDGTLNMMDAALLYREVSGMA